MSYYVCIFKFLKISTCSKVGKKMETRTRTVFSFNLLHKLFSRKKKSFQDEDEQRKHDFHITHFFFFFVLHVCQKFVEDEEDKKTKRVFFCVSQSTFYFISRCI
eukprot:GDKK01079170.1.p1 GENE.GDKK01079170.1~~GDKK01079170.1.p1  ORF type:complete len:104 (+),score=16.21 GDKK01079170.1:164-475(+)